jgi:transcriptional regulator with XRE-family HTH domain
MNQHAEKGHRDLAAFMRNTRNKRIDNAGKPGQWTQPYIARLMRVHKDKYARFENGEQMPSIRELGRWGEQLQLDRQEWEQLEHYIQGALHSESSDTNFPWRSNTKYVILNKLEDQVEHLTCFDKYHAYAQFPPKTRVRFPFTMPTSIIIPTYTHPDSRLFSTVPEDDQRAAGIIEAFLRRFDIETETIPCSTPAAPQNPAEHEMILVGGPGRNGSALHVMLAGNDGFAIY